MFGLWAMREFGPPGIALMVAHLLAMGVLGLDVDRCWRIASGRPPHAGPLGLLTPAQGLAGLLALAPVVAGLTWAAVRRSAGGRSELYVWHGLIALSVIGILLAGFVIYRMLPIPADAAAAYRRLYLSGVPLAGTVLLLFWPSALAG